MQRAAATRGTDATAAEAIEHLKAFRRDSVGAVRVGATGPLWAAIREQEAAEAGVAEAQRIHGDYLDREARLEDASSEHLAAQGDLVSAEAELAKQEADELSARAERATALGVDATLVRLVFGVALVGVDGLARGVDQAGVDTGRRRVRVPRARPRTGDGVPRRRQCRAGALRRTTQQASSDCARDRRGVQSSLAA